MYCERNIVQTAFWSFSPSWQCKQFYRTCFFFSSSSFFLLFFHPTSLPEQKFMTEAPTMSHIRSVRLDVWFLGYYTFFNSSLHATRERWEQWLPIIEPYCCWAEDSYGSWADDGGKHKPDPGDRQAQSAVHTLKLVPSVLPYQWTPSILPACCSRLLLSSTWLLYTQTLLTHCRCHAWAGIILPDEWLNTYGAYRHSQRDPGSQPWDMCSYSIARAHLPPAPF